ncbi:MAG: TolC family outer membrane protein [Pseudomonadales bacterium]|nr:TolC family outer membrane protein [Pseudomonadales bacterium]
MNLNVKRLLRQGLCLIGSLLILGQFAQAANLAEIYDLAVINDPQLGAAKATYRAVKESTPQARAGLLPKLTIQGRTTDTRRTVFDVENEGRIFDFTDKYNENGWQAILSQPLFQLDAWFLFRQAKNLEAQALAQFAAEQQALIFRVSESYLNILQAEDQLAASNAERDAVKRQLEQVQQRFDVGLVAITDVLESTAAFDSSTVNVIEAEGVQVISFETLLRLTSQPYNSIEGLAEKFPVEYPEPNNEEAWVQRALEGSYTLLASREGVHAAERNLHAARSRHLPTVGAEITFAESASGGSNNFGNEVEQTAAQLNFNVPIFSGGATRSAAKQAGFQLQQAQKNHDLAKRTVVENTRNLFSAINTDVARVRARLRGIESSQSALDATQTGYEVGTRNIVDVLLAQQRLYQAQFQYASARYQYIKDTLRLKESVGSLNPDDIYSLSQFMTTEKTVTRTTSRTR